MIYLDSSVALAQLFAEDRAPSPELWVEPLISSRLLSYEIWNRINGRRLGTVHAEAARSLIGRIAVVEMAPAVLERALDPFPVSVRTLDALHLASIEFLRARGQVVELATYDRRMAAGAAALGIPLATF